MEYQISKKAVEAITKHGMLFSLLAVANNKNDTSTIRRWLYKNRINGPLITNVNIGLISEHTGLTKDSIVCSPSPTQPKMKNKKK